MTKTSGPAALGPSNYRTMARQLVPGAVLPGMLYFLTVRHTSTMVALAVAASVPALDFVVRLARGKRPTFVGTAFLAITGASIVLGTWLRAPWIIMGKGAAISGVLGAALAISATVGRPLSRAVALRLLTELPEERRRLRGRWDRPQTTAVFRTLALGWGLWLLISAAQQGALVATLSPGIFMAIEPPIRLTLTAIGIGASILYVRRRQRTDPELGLLPG